MSPHNVPEASRVEMLADCPVDHPFFVKDKGESLLINCTELDMPTQRIIGGKNLNLSDKKILSSFCLFDYKQEGVKR